MSQLGVGIIGGGQLAMMGLSAAKDLGIHCLALVNSMDEPAAVEHPDSCLLSTEVENFSKSIHTLTFESEFFDSALFNLIITKNPKIEAMPRSADILRVSDKLEQKELFATLEIDQARYWKLEKSSFEPQLTKALSASSNFCVLKWAKGGYDGKGNFFLRQSGSQISSEDLLGAREFCEEAWRKGAAVYAEEGIPFESECALVHVQALENCEGPASINYPVVETRQSNGICLETWGAKGSELDVSSAGAAARDAASLIGAHFPKLPVFAVEFFLAKDGRLLANEMAPRVHNSGHYSLLDGPRSQFHNWMRSLARMPLEPWSSSTGFVMRNWLGAEDGTKNGAEETFAPDQAKYISSKIQFIDYHKKHRPGRKLGHLSKWAKADESVSDVKDQLEKLDPSSIKS